MTLVSSLTVKYNNTMKELVAKHASLITRMITDCPHAEWYTSKLEKKKKRKLERRYVKTMSSEYAHEFPMKCAHVSDLLIKTCKMFYCQQIQEQSGNQNGLLKVFNTVQPPLSAHDTLEELVNRFSLI